MDVILQVSEKIRNIFFFSFSFEHATLHWVILHAVVQTIQFGLLDIE
jgi:hypothetical protein